MVCEVFAADTLQRSSFGVTAAVLAPVFGLAVPVPGVPVPVSGFTGVVVPVSGFSGVVVPLDWEGLPATGLHRWYC